MKLFRQVLFWLHLSAGLTAGFVVAIMSITGVGLTYQRQIQSWADRGGWRPPAGAAPLPIEVLIEKLREQEPGATPTTVTLRAESHQLASAALTGSRTGTVLVDPYTGQIVPAAALGNRVRAVYRGMTEWHRYVGASGESRANGRMLTGASNLLFFFLVLSGVYLWWPKSWRWTALSNVLLFRGGLTPKARDFNWHNVIGFWSAIPLVVVVGSGVVMSYSWANNLVYRAAGEAPPTAAGGARGNGPGPMGEGRGGGRGDMARPEGAGGGRGEASRMEGSGAGSPALVSSGLNAVVATAASQFPAWQSLAVRVPATDRAPVTIAVDEGDGGQPQKRGTLTLDRATTGVTKWEPFSSQTTGRRWRSYLRFAHTGESMGLIGQTIAGAVSAGAAFLVYTGLTLAGRRLMAFLDRRRRVKRVASAPSART